MKVNNGGYKIVKEHYLDEDPSIIHDEHCTDIVYRIDTGNGSYSVAYAKFEEAQAKLEELLNTRN